MAQKKYLDLTGLAKFLSNVTSRVETLLSGKADKGHTHDDRYYTESEVDSKLSGKANASHTHDDRYYTETEMNSKLDAKADVGHTHTVDSSLSSTSVNPVQNKVINSALSGKVPTTRTVNGKPLSANITLVASDVGADANGAANSALVSAKSYTDGKVANLLNNSTEAVDSIMELADAMKTNKDAIDSLNSIAASKANASDLNAHKKDTTVHVTSTERNNWNAAKTHAGTAHAPSNAQANQNAFSNVTVGATTIAADTQTDNLTLAGSNVTLTPDATNDKITIGLTKANVTSALGYTPPTTNTTYGVGTASSLGLTKLYTGTGMAVDGTMTQNAITNALGGKANSSHTHTTAQVSGLDSALAGKAASSHTHTISNVTNLQTELDKKQDKTQPVTTSGTGAAYTATVPGITSLTAGVSFTMIPNVVSTTVSPTLNVNGLGAKQIRQRLSNGTVSTATGATANWLAAGKPVGIMYDGAFWVVDFVRPNMTSAYGTLPVANGGTGCTNSSDAASHLIDSLAVGATTATDNDYLICQVPNSGTAHKRPMSVVWNWVKAKCDSIYQPKGSYASSSHTHNSIKDAGDGRDITFNYSADGAQDATWFAVWNGSELKSMSKQQMKSSLGISSSDGVNIGKIVYPVGAVYISWSSTSPAALFGGSWAAITGRFPYFNAGTGTGGSNSHTLSVSEMPSHRHTQNVSAGDGGWAQRCDYVSDGKGFTYPQGVETDPTGGSAPHNNMPAYQTLYAWRRTA